MNVAASQDFEIIPWSAYRDLDKEAKEIYYNKYLEIRKLAKPKIDDSF